MGTIIFIIAASAWLLGWAHSKGRPSKLAEFIRNNPKRTSICLVHNGLMLTDYNADSVMPLASTVKIIIAIEYAQQVASGNINPDERIDITDVERYYIPGTDGGAHPKWRKEVNKNDLIKNGMVRLEDIAKGMIRFSSNANTEFLLEKLGLENINSNLEKLDLKAHQLLYPFISSLLIYKEVTKEEIEEMPMNAYIDFANVIHNGLQTGQIGYKDIPGKVPLEIQKIWSDRLPGSTTKEYVSLLNKINSRTYFDTTTQKHIEILMGGMMDNAKNKSRLDHAGMKGGSTAFVLTLALYATTKSGETTEMAYFFNNLTVSENILWQTCLNNFNRAILKDEKTRNKLLAIINSPQ